MQGDFSSLKQISLDLRSDTASNLNSLAQAVGVPRIELIRRGSEVALLLSGLSVIEACDSLIESLKRTESNFSKFANDRQKLAKSLSESSMLAAALSAASTVNRGLEKSEMLNMYFRAIREHSDILADQSIKFGDVDQAAIKLDVTTFANFLVKFRELVVSEEEENNGAIRARTQKGRPKTTA